MGSADRSARAQGYVCEAQLGRHKQHRPRRPRGESGQPTWFGTEFHPTEGTQHLDVRQSGNNILGLWAEQVRQTGPSDHFADFAARRPQRPQLLLGDLGDWDALVLERDDEDAAQVWRYLVDTSTWESYYDNVADIPFPQNGGPELKKDIVFSLGTFGFPPLDARVVEFQDPAQGMPGRLSWTAKQDGTPEERLDVLHAWLVEDLPGGRVRILTQETQIGRPAAALAGSGRTRRSTATRHGWTAS
ncbi:hypothetical protein ACIBBD_29365 [Streptomyces sp. NPDC051315]|uniref:hypothetical protein n=1 Tax=Streptomyces sp. NPDC051315 TaxID=3365650 RepID=UPI0037895BD0